jgi:predicted outer membrane repeat protein
VTQMEMISRIATKMKICAILIGVNVMKRWIVILFILVLAQVCSAATIYVPSGSATIQAGINAASEGDTVLVAYGTYTGAGNRDIDFNGKNVILLSEYGPELTIIDCQGSETTPYRAFRFVNGEDTTSIVEGFTLTNGYGSVEYSNSRGGALYCHTSSPKFINCIFSDNFGYDNGGAVATFASSPIFIDCSFINNFALHGGGVYFNGDIPKNSKALSEPKLINCTFINNVAGASNGYGGGMYVQYGGIIVTVEDCVFYDNSAYYGGGLAVKTDANINISNCTFVKNSTGYGGSLHLKDYGLTEISNTIIAFSLGGLYGGRGLYADNTDQLFITCCDIFGNYGGDWVYNISSYYGVNGNIASDPLFCDFNNDDYHIDFNSPCSPFLETECGLIGALTVNCGDIPVPLATDITFNPILPGNIITSLEPEIIWTYFDTASTTQAAYEIEVGTDDDWSVAEMWDTDQVFASDTNILYAGMLLLDNTQYFVRIRVQNGSTWGDWTESNFWTHVNTAIKVPTDQPTIQAGIDIAIVGDTVLVADGIYIGAGNRDINFNGKNIVVMSENGPEVTVINCEGSGVDNHRGFLFENYENSTSVIDGFTIQNGFIHGDGGAILCIFASPTILNCYFNDNYSSVHGGAIYFQNNSNSTLTDCVFEQNHAQNWGGAVACHKSSVVATGCQFISNLANYSGGIHLNGSSASTITSCLLAQNAAGSAGGGLGAYNSAFADVSNCTFAKNYAGSNGCGIKTEDNLVVSNCIIAFGNGSEAVNGSVSASCCDIFGNAGGDWVGSISSYLGVDGNISEDPLFCDTSQSDFRIQGHSPCSPYINAECLLIGALDPGCNTMIEFPLAAYINFGPASIAHTVYLAEPEIFWSYIDTAATSQTHYEIEVGTDDDWTIAEMWSSGEVWLSDTSVVYAGLPLTQGQTYFVRVRVSNGTNWGSWLEEWFYFSSSFVVKVPGLAPTIQAGIDLTLSGDTVLVAPGTYTGAGNWDIDFGGRNIVVISEQGPDVTIIDSEGSQSVPHRAFDFITGETSSAILEGFTITGGYGHFVDDYYIGGAVYLDNSSPTINNCIFDQNNAETGGAIYCETASPIFNDCEFSTNTTTIQGGAIASFNAAPTFNICRFSDNSGGNKGGAIASYESVSNLNVCIFDNNSAQDGGAVHFDGFVGKRSSTVTLDSCLLYENIAQTNGGAVYFGANTAASLLNCTLADNQGSTGSGVFIQSSSLLELENCIISYGVSGEAVFCDEPGIPNVTCCDIYGNEGGDWTGCINSLADVNGNISNAPKFCNRLDDDYSLMDPNSLCLPENNSCGVLIGALGGGCNGYYCGDSNGDTDVSVSDAVWIISYVFVGADAPSPYLSGDANCDYLVNVSDAVWIINYVFIGGNAPCDPSGDGIPDC